MEFTNETSGNTKRKTEGMMRMQPELSEREGWIESVWRFWRRSSGEGDEAWVYSTVQGWLQLRQRSKSRMQKHVQLE